MALRRGNRVGRHRRNAVQAVATSMIEPSVEQIDQAIEALKSRGPLSSPEAATLDFVMQEQAGPPAKPDDA